MAMLLEVPGIQITEFRAELPNFSMNDEFYTTALPERPEKAG
jgi:hypothetical protein